LVPEENALDNPLFMDYIFFVVCFIYFVTFKKNAFKQIIFCICQRLRKQITKDSVFVDQLK